MQREIEECLPESQIETNIDGDAISLVFGKEARGRVRGLGFGVTPSRVGACVQQNGKIKQLEESMQEMMRQMQEMKSMIMHNQRQQNQQEQVRSWTIH